MRTSFLPYVSAASLALALSIAAYYVMETTPEVTYVAPPTPSCDTFECIVTLRTKQNFERDQLKYMEQARLSALQELNKEAQDMVYVSPYTETPSSN